MRRPLKLCRSFASTVGPLARTCYELQKGNDPIITNSGQSDKVQTKITFNRQHHGKATQTYVTTTYNTEVRNTDGGVYVEKRKNTQKNLRHAKSSV